MIKSSLLREIGDQKISSYETIEDLWFVLTTYGKLRKIAINDIPNPRNNGGDEE